MAFFKNMDLYKVVILLSVVLIPGALGWAFHLRGEIDTGHRAIDRARLPAGEIEQIGTLMKELRMMAAEKKRNDAARPQNFHTYFQTRVYESLSGDNQLKSDEMQFVDSINRSAPAGAQDFVVKVSFTRDRKSIPFGRDVLMAFLFNAESQSRGIWKLRSLSITNKAMADQRGDGTPPVETPDQWIIARQNGLEFACRQRRNQ